MILYCELLWLITLFSCFNAQTEVPARVVTLLGEDSYVDYKPVEWNYTGDGPQLILPIRFRTRSIGGRLITLSARGSQDTIFTLYAYIDNAAIVVDLNDGERKLIKKTERQLPGANNGAEHSMSIHLNPETKILKMVYGQGTVDSYDFIDDIKVEHQMLLTIRTGSNEGQTGIIGCVAIVGLTVGSRFVFQIEENVRFGTIRDSCDTLCSENQCNKGTCVDLFHTAVCDCRGTYQSGERCDAAMKTVNVSWDQYISYKISKDESQPTIISIDFKTSVKEGLIIHGAILSLENDEPLGKLKLALIYGQLRLTIAHLAEINFDDVTLSSERFNQIILEFEYNLDLVHMTLNGNTKSTSLNTDDKQNHIRFGNELFFCAGDSEVGLSGCLRGIYVGYFDVIEGYTKNSSKVSASAGLKSCDGTDLVAKVVPDTVILPILIPEEEIQEKPLNEITEEQEKKEHGHILEPAHELGNDREINHKHGHKHEEKAEDDTNQQDDDGDKPKEQEQTHSKDEDDRTMIGGAFVTESITEPPTKPCENDEATSCKNSIKCIRKGGTPICICNKGFTGRYCQFSLLPWNCDEIFHEGNAVSGTYIIDPDGSGPLPETYAYCQYGKTIIPHNMPNNTLIHSEKLGDIYMMVNYKLFNDEQLQSLKDHSKSCTQTVRYHCRGAPLGFNSMKTWFSSIPNKYFVGLGGNGGTCPCQDNNCEQCKCDGGDITVDYGVMTGVQAPIRRVYSLNDASDNEGYLTLGPLICTGSVGQSAEYTMTIRKQFNPEKIGSWSGNSLSFEFRTYLESCTLLSSNDEIITIAMVDRTLHLLYNNQVNLALTPQSRKNDGYWHRIVVDIRDGSIRFSVDDTVATTEIKQPSFSKTQLSIGGGRDGFLGCVRQILVDGVLIKVDQEIMQGICANLCESHNCQHESRCEENFATETRQCVCKNPVVHSGNLCQNSINYETEISYHDTKRAFLKAQNLTVANVLMQRLVFSFRTDQRDALLIYLHDQLYNFVQVHLSDHSHMVLTLNYNRTVRRCEVVAKAGNEFSRMKWIQVMIFQFSDSVELNVDDEICQIPGQRILSTDFIKKFEIASDIDDVVEPPVSPVMTEDSGYSNPYVLFFVGGVPTENYLGSLEPIYRSSVQNFLGCMRGLMIGAELIDMRDRDYWAYYPIETGMIKTGCETGCHEIDQLCKNAGHCAVQWTAKDVQKDASCNCARTSYYGPYCDQDNGAYFAGHSVLVFNLAEILDKVIFDWNQLDEQAFSFAFSATTTANPLNLMTPQVLATIHFEHNRMMQIVLCKNGSLNVGVASEHASFVHTFPYNYSDGYRHYFQFRFGKNKPLKVTIDSLKYSFPADVTTRLSLAYATKFFFGGLSSTKALDERMDGKKMAKHNYTGCISNIDIDMNVASMNFKPISYLRNSDLKFAESATVVGNQLQLGACNSFLIPGSLPPVLNIVTSPVWESPFVIGPYERSVDDMMAAEERFKWWILVLIIFLVLLLVLCIATVRYYLKTRKQRPKKPDICGCPENSPLISDEKKEEPAFVIKNDFALPEPDQPLGSATFNESKQTSVQPYEVPATEAVVVNQPPVNSRASTVSGMSGVTMYFTASTTFDSDDDYEDLVQAPQGFDDDFGLEDTLLDNDLGNMLVPNQVKMHNFNRNTPQRISSFKRGDPTAPPDSPLYKPLVTRRPKPVLPPRTPVKSDLESST